MSDKLDGPAPVEDKLLWKTMRKKGIKEEDIPDELQNSVVHKTKRDKLGQIVVRRMTGIQNSSAHRVVQQFEKNIGGVEDLKEKLGAIAPELSQEQKKFFEVLMTNTSKKGLSRLLAETGVGAISIMNAYARGALELGKVQAAIECHRNLPAIAEEITKMALSKAGLCGACGGGGRLHAKAGDHEDTEMCMFCGGRGRTEESPHKRFAIEKYIELEGLVEKQPMVQVAVGVKVGDKGENVFAKMMKATDEVLFRKARPSAEEEVVEAEIVRGVEDD